MAISITNVAATTSGATTASFTAIAGRYYFVCAHSLATSTLSAASGNGITWALLRNGTNSASGGHTFALFGGLCTSGSTGTVTVTGSAGVSDVMVDEVTGGRPTSTAVQSAVALANKTVTLSAFASASNATYFLGFASVDASAPEAGYTNLTGSNILTAWIFSAWKSTSDTTPSFVSTDTTGNAIIGVELSASSVTNWLSPSANLTTVGWTGPGNVYAQDAVNATVSVSGGAETPYFRVNGFNDAGTPLATLLSGATSIDGIELQFYGNTNGAIDYDYVLVGNVNLGTPQSVGSKAIGLSTSGTSAYTTSIGGPGDLWGGNGGGAWVVADLGSDFGPNGAWSSTTARTVTWDYVRMRIYYTPAAGGGGASGKTWWNGWGQGF